MQISDGFGAFAQAARRCSCLFSSPLALAA